MFDKKQIKEIKKQLEKLEDFLIDQYSGENGVYEIEENHTIIKFVRYFYKNPRVIMEFKKL